MDKNLLEEENTSDQNYSEEETQALIDYCNYIDKNGTFIDLTEQVNGLIKKWNIH